MMTHGRRPPLRTAGLIAVAVLLAIVGLALHPHVNGHVNMQLELHEIDTLSARDRLVHGTLLLLLGASLSGLTRYAVRRGLTRLAVIAGLLSFGIGICALIAAGLIDGFILPELAAHFVAASSLTYDAVRAILTACSVAVNVVTAFGFTATAIAICAWSLDLAYDDGESRVAGIVGFVSAALIIIALVMGGSSIKPHTLMAVVGAQGVWYVWVAVLLAREKA